MTRLRVKETIQRTVEGQSEGLEQVRGWSRLPIVEQTGLFASRRDAIYLPGQSLLALAIDECRFALEGVRVGVCQTVAG